MSDAGSSTEGAPFSRGGVLALLVVGAGVLLALLYLLAIGDIGPQDGDDGGSHAGSQGINGYSALVELVEADGFETDVSRSPSELETSDILVLTPPGRMEPDELEAILDEREFRGPTLVILPKWNAFPPRFMGEVEDPDKIREGWVLLAGTSTPRWSDEDSGPLALGIKPGGALAVEADAVEEASSPEAETAPRPNLQPRRFRTLGAIAGISGELPTATGVFADHKEPHFPIVVDGENRPIALALDSGRYEEPDIDSRPSHWIVFVVDPDLMNNWGIADPARARTALSIVRTMGLGDKERVVFDMTLNGFGGTVNLLTLAFQPPFLAATICLLLAMFIIAWRAFLRFGPAAVPVRETAFGKARLVTNGADLILRAGRLKLLIEPYITLSARRIARSLALPKSEPAAIDAALAVREPDAPSFTEAAQELRSASGANEILRAARTLNQRIHRP